MFIEGLRREDYDRIKLSIHYNVEYEEGVSRRKRDLEVILKLTTPIFESFDRRTVSIQKHKFSSEEMRVMFNTDMHQAMFGQVFRAIAENLNFTFGLEERMHLNRVETVITISTASPYDMSFYHQLVEDVAKQIMDSVEKEVEFVPNEEPKEEDEDLLDQEGVGAVDFEVDDLDEEEESGEWIADAEEEDND